MSRACPFERLLVAGSHACSRALPVTRREGAGVDCDDASACARCGALQEFFMQVGAEAFGEVEDRTQVAHGTLLKIQIGGLAGTAQCLNRSADEAAEDIGELARKVESPALLDRGILAAAMREARARRRRGSRRGE